MTSVALTLLGFGLGALVIANQRSNPDPRANSDRRGSTRDGRSLRNRAIEAQKFSARASQEARELAFAALAEQDKGQDR